jgi:uncharacterized membrane protein YidH (DUF202 family)
LKGFFGGGKKADPIHSPNNATSSMVKQRKAPIKVEPKVFFANERTFLAWTHISIILAGASIAILSMTDEKASTGSQLYGIVTLPVAVAFLVYSMYQCKYLYSTQYNTHYTYAKKKMKNTVYHDLSCAILAIIRFF